MAKKKVHKRLSPNEFHLAVIAAMKRNDDILNTVYDSSPATYAYSQASIAVMIKRKPSTHMLNRLFQMVDMDLLVLHSRNRAPDSSVAPIAYQFSRKV